jgi:hypothetical protein
MAPNFCAQFRGEVTIESIREELRANAHPGCHSCHGTGTLLSEQPEAGTEINMANENARAFLGLIGVAFDFCGTIPFSAIPNVIRRLIVVVSSARVRNVIVDQGYEIPGTPGMLTPVREGNLVRLVRTGGSAGHCYGGRSDEYVSERATQFMAFLRLAQDRGSDVTWW